MQLIILAAGLGARISPAIDSLPKSLIELELGKTILDRQLEAAKSSGIEKVRVVVGYRAEDIEAKLKSRSDLGLDVDVFYNPFFKVTSNLVSIWMARPAMFEDFIIVNGDDVFRPSVLGDLVNAKEDFQAVISRKSRYDEDDSKIRIEGENIVEISKDIPLSRTNGEWIGMCAVRGPALNSYVSVLDRVIRDSDFINGPHYLSFYQVLIDSGQDMNFHEIESDVWAEIDYQMDLDYVQANMTRFADGQ
jgi:choline kinase